MIKIVHILNTFLSFPHYLFSPTETLFNVWNKTQRQHSTCDSVQLTVVVNDACLLCSSDAFDLNYGVGLLRLQEGFGLDVDMDATFMPDGLTEDGEYIFVSSSAKHYY